MLHSILQSAALGVLSGLFAKLTYSAVRDEWPESYVYGRSTLQKTRGSGLVKYLLFRIVPILLSAYLGSAVTDSLGLPALPFGMAAWGTFVSVTWVPHVYRSFRQRLVRRGSDLVGAIARAVLATIPVSVGTWAGSMFPQFSPSPSELVTAAWTALLVGVIALGAKRTLATDSLAPAESVMLAMKDVGAGWDSIRTIAIETGVEAAILQSVVTVEVHQRPRWFRFAERTAGLVKRNMTYGIAQMRAERPISDLESVRRLAEESLTLPPPQSSSVHQRFLEYVPILEARGATLGYVDEVRDIYRYLFDPSDIQETDPAEPRADVTAEPIGRLRILAAKAFHSATLRLLRIE